MRKFLGGSLWQSVRFLLPLVLLGSMSACSLQADWGIPLVILSSPTSTVGTEQTQKADTTVESLDFGLTQPSLTPTPIVTRTAVARQENGTPTPVDIPCDRAGVGAILDVTYPDDSRLLPGQSFTKVWRLVNRGSCTWDRNYKVVWFSGDRLGISSTQPLPGRVEPGQSVDIAVDMIAPQQPGLYTSYWMLRNPQGELFGIGPAGNAPFWVRIQVIAAFTPTPSSTPTLTPTPVVLVSGRLNLSIGQGIDLDRGEVTNDGGVDIWLNQTEEGSVWIEAHEDAGLMIFGEGQPSLNDCRSAIFSTSRIEWLSLPEGTFLCYRTGEGLTGFMRVISYVQMPFSVWLDFTTWFIP